MEEIRVIPLGTISPYEKDSMNCPGYLIKYRNKKILLDCGSGITRLLKFPEDLNKLNIIITHYHKDHYSDIGSIQYASYVYHNLGLISNKVNIYLPKNDFNYSKKSIVNNKESYCNYIDVYDGYNFNIEDLNIKLKDNKSHSIESFMVKIENNNVKIVYTSDIGTTNLNDLICFCKNSDLLICESSFLKKHNTDCKTHFTAYDAGILAKDAKVKKLLLTHLWPEEDKKLYLEEAKSVFENTEIAKEGKTLKLWRNC